MYFTSQSLHGSSYTTLWFSGGILSFTCTSNCLMVLCGLNTVLTPSGAHAFSNFSLVPQMYGVYRIVGLSSGWLSSSTYLGNRESVFFTSCSGKPLAVKTSSRCCISAGLLVSSQTWRAQLRIPRITRDTFSPVFYLFQLTKAYAAETS